MPRSVPEWIGQNADDVPPPRVRLRVFESMGGRCHRCDRKIATGENWTLEHVIALINGGENRESNLDVTCRWCLPDKNREDAAIKKHGSKVRYAHRGIRRKSRPIPGSRASGLRKRMNGTVERR